MRAGRTSSGRGGVGGMTCARVLAGGPRVGRRTVRASLSGREPATGIVLVRGVTLLPWALNVGVHADVLAHSFPTNADARGEAVQTMPRTLACCPLYCGVQGRHQGHSLVGLMMPRMQIASLKTRQAAAALADACSPVYSIKHIICEFIALIKWFMLGATL